MNARIAIDAPIAMQPARRPADKRYAARMMVIDAEQRSVEHRSISDFAQALRPGDVVVVNDAATLPASLMGEVHGQPVELRLLARGATDDRWTAVLFGAGHWRTPTEHRPAPPRVAPEDVILFSGVAATIESVRAESGRLLEIRFDLTGDRLWQAVYRIGRPVQYSYLDGELDLWSVQTAFASRPWAVELPSAGWSLGVELIAELRKRGIEVVSLTHAAGLSSTGDETLDAALPLAERFDIPQATVSAIAQAKSSGGRVIAIGTTVVRALEGSARGAALPIAGEGSTTLRIGPGYRASVVDGLITGMHAPGESHYELLRGFVDDELLSRATGEAADRGYLCHEFGDLTLTIPASKNGGGGGR
jgi:S-adenosylmethionine:tRNA ribosyltransferase-isomerase